MNNLAAQPFQAELSFKSIKRVIKKVNGSGLPIPAKGSRKMARTNSSRRLAVRRSVATQCCKSSKNSG